MDLNHSTQICHITTNEFILLLHILKNKFPSHEKFDPQLLPQSFQIYRNKVEDGKLEFADLFESRSLLSRVLSRNLQTNTATINNIHATLKRL